MRKHSRQLSCKCLKAVPNMLTICNSLCGFVAILWTLRAYELDSSCTGKAMEIFSISAVMIFAAMIFDAFDGFAARLLNAASLHGIQMDSLSDMVTFGVAPATLVAVMTHWMRDWNLHGVQMLIVYALASVYLGCAALRLATYNVHAMNPPEHRGNPNWFSGLPSPGAAAAVCVVVFYAHSAQIDFHKVSIALPVYTAVLGLLMVSRLPYLHAGRWLMSLRRQKSHLIYFLLMLAIVVIFKVNGVMVLVTGYILSGPVVAVVRLFSRRKEEQLS